MLLVGFHLGRYPSRVFAIIELHIYGASKPSLGSASHRVPSKVQDYGKITALDSMAMHVIRSVFSPVISDSIQDGRKHDGGLLCCIK